MPYGLCRLAPARARPSPRVLQTNAGEQTDRRAPSSSQQAYRQQQLSAGIPTAQCPPGSTRKMTIAEVRRGSTAIAADEGELTRERSFRLFAKKSTRPMFCGDLVSHHVIVQLHTGSLAVPRLRPEWLHSSAPLSTTVQLAEMAEMRKYESSRGGPALQFGSPRKADRERPAFL